MHLANRAYDRFFESINLKSKIKTNYKIYNWYINLVNNRNIVCIPCRQS